MSGAIEGVVHTNLESDSSQSAAQRQELESAFGSVLGSVALQMMDRNMANLHEAVAETEEDT
ncbi:hypothetical protein QA640_39645 [Bradyrhizobium sp. CB82]|uniref:hypothetical protein n=1 Tax=Bradyrhizobium sp. CB82 TaxID=3039159 RepID=UPI0024B0BFE4|nr:hypothetical protein [Bradyrhizobium sp. CB82]WFU40249.1 hypothetical protein QA640_39645 [Bradyrhizobium sp. CB82]